MEQNISHKERWVRLVIYIPIETSILYQLLCPEVPGFG